MNRWLDAAWAKEKNPHNMKLSPEELRWLEDGERRERLWPFTRWICLAISALSFGLAGYLSYNLLGPLHCEAERDVATLAWVTPFVWLSFVHGFMWLVLVVGKWRGDCQHRILLKLISEHKDSQMPST